MNFYLHEIERLVLPNGIEKIDYRCSEDDEKCVSIMWQANHAKEIVVPFSVQYVHPYAFTGLKNLERLVIPRYLLKEKLFFEHCDKYVKVIPISRTAEEKEVFNKYRRERKIVLPNDLKVIYDNMFAGYRNLKEIEIPEGVTKIGDSAFACCENLKRVKIPSSVKEIGNLAFAYCQNLECVEFSEGVKKLGVSTFSHCSSLEEIVIPSTVSELTDAIFDSCTKLRNIQLPPNMFKIRYLAFRGCTNLNKIVLPENLLELCLSAFDHCSKLEKLEIPKGAGISLCIELDNLKEVKVYSGTRILDPIRSTKKVSEYCRFESANPDFVVNIIANRHIKNHCEKFNLKYTYKSKFDVFLNSLKS